MSGTIPDEIIDRAAGWLVEMRESEIVPSKREAFADWLRRSPAHVQAYLEVAGLWGDSAQLDPSQDFGVTEALRASQGASNVAVLDVASQEQPRRGSRANEGWGKTSRPKLIAFAAALLVSVGAGTLIWWNVARPVYTADVGEQRTLTLDDGSIVRLNSRSKVRVSISPALRQVDLLEGQAMFEVAKDHSRPFMVRSEDVFVRATGTQFDVYGKKIGTVVTVVEGQVEIESSDSRQKLSASAGEQVMVNRAGTVDRNEKPNIVAATSWVQQRLIFTGEPLGTVVEEFNRYSRRTITVTDPSLAELRINAVFHSTNPDSLLKFVARYPGIEVVESDTGIRIARRESAQ